MLKNRGRDPRAATAPAASLPTQQQTMRHQVQAHPTSRQPTQMPAQRALPSRPEPDYEVVEFPTEQYVNAKLQPPPPPPPRPTVGHPVDAGASCGLCGGGGARVRCAECGRRALCASCDDMYHRHPKRRNHQRQAISALQMRDERPPLPPKAGAPVPPPRRHKISGDRLSASPRPPGQDQRRSTLGHLVPGHHNQTSNPSLNNHIASQHALHQTQLQLQAKISAAGASNHLGSMPYLPSTIPHAPAPVAQLQGQSNTLGHLNSAWARPRGSLQGFNMPPNMVPHATWDNHDNISPTDQGWTRPLRRGASVLELGGGAPQCVGCAHCVPAPWRYGSCASLDHPWASGWQPPCCGTPHPPTQMQMHPHSHQHPPQTPQPYRRVESRTVSRAASRAGSRAVSPAVSTRSRASRRTKHRTPSPPPLPSSDADSESECESDHAPVHKQQEKAVEESLGPVLPPPSASWQCEHCTFVNEPGVRVCVVCCRTPTSAPKIIAADSSINMERLKITESPPSRVALETKHLEQNGGRATPRSKKERTSIACGTSPPKEGIPTKKTVNRLVTPTREPIASDRTEQIRRHDMAVGPSPPREEQQNHRPIEQSLSHEPSKTMKVSPYREIKEFARIESTNQHSVSVGPSPPREITTLNTSHVIPNKSKSLQKKSTGTSPQRETIDTRSSSALQRGKVSNTGTSPPPQSISTQTYEVPSTWERAPSAARSRPRRRFRDEERRERSHSRHSMSSDTRESERSVRTSAAGAGGGGGRWEWRERDSSPGGEWSEGYSRLSRRASHLDLRRTRSTRRSSYYGSEAASPEPQSATRAISLEALAGASGKREAERGLELSRLMSDAERLGFSAAEVQAALAQSPAAPLAWLRARWPSLVAGVRAAAARLAPALPITDMDARAALAKHKGAMWPAVTECVERHRNKPDAMSVGEERRLRGRVWGSPAGADDDAAPPLTSIHRSHRTRAEDSSDEFEQPTPTEFQDDQWMYLPLENENKITYMAEHDFDYRNDNYITEETPRDNTEEIAQKLKKLLAQAGVPSINEKLLLRGLLSDNTVYKNAEENNALPNKIPSIDLIQSENDFIDAYNALTRTSPLPNINSTKISQNFKEDISLASEQEIYDVDRKELENVIDSSVNSEESPAHNNAQLNQNLQTSKNGSDNNLLQNAEQQEKVNLTNGNISEQNHIKENVLNEKSNNSPENNDNSIEIIKTSEERESNMQSEEKSNNLNDIVDNTQKLIQKMKEEINSDINSLDGTNISHSEPDTSSNDEQESSYSDTEEGSDNLTSDEKETSSSEHDEIPQLSRKDTLTNYRTSSEDNEQFEEALDHLDNQIENFKHTNIEILDSIAKSLQKEHTITVEISESKGITIPQQDLNNNLFVAVNTFEEIYEDLNGDIANRSKITEPTLQTSVNVSESIKSDMQEIKLFEKHALNLSLIKTEWPIKLIFSEHIQPVFQARLENIKETLIVDTINNQMDNDIQVENTNNHNQSDLSMTNTRITSTEVESNRIDANSDKSRSVSPIQHGHLQIITKDTNINVSEQVDTNSVDVLPILQSNVINNPENIYVDNKVQSNELETNNKINSISDKTSSHVNNNNSKNPTGVKSNIPKLIKLPQNTKAKTDKNSPKLIVSKVPIRRASIKQYPAPAPPKSHFGNVQSGHVKQLQTRLFNSKSSKANDPAESDLIKPSTSTLNKKKPAPAPPVEPQGEKHPSPPKQSQLTEKKNNYFRETCRTEDEWTESDSEDSQLQTIKSNEEPNPAPPSPPPPITLRRVSGQLIDLAKVRLPEGSPERQARMLLAEGATETWDQAQLAIDLVSRGIEPAVALLAALECADLNAALAYLHQDCELCASRFPEHEMVSMLRCTHRCCRECAHHYFTVQITERSIVDCVCPYCKAPELENLPEDAWLEYFAHLDILLKTLLETDVHELFQRKLRDRTLARDPNFRWCMECSSGFFVHPKHKKLRCPECKSVTCASCRKPWSTNHEGLSCEQYTVWLEDNDPERSVAAVQQHLRENGLECPRCHFRYSLSRGGCMHFTCTQCKYEFCYGCGKTFTMGARCGLSEYCAKLGLHAHHPRNCLFYLRDKEPHELQTLLQMNNVTYETEAAEGAGRCPVQLQRETPTGLVDGTCGNDVPPNYAGLCKNHYLEYLSRLVRRCNVDPLPILGVDDLETLVRRAALRLPPRPYGTLEGLYKRGLIEIVKEKIPLD